MTISTEVNAVLPLRQAAALDLQNRPLQAQEHIPTAFTAPVQAT